MWSYFKGKPMPYKLREGSKLVLSESKCSHFDNNSFRFK